jgi:hypothetical protein
MERSGERNGFEYDGQRMSDEFRNDDNARWKASGEIGPNPERCNSPSILYMRHFYHHQVWVQTEGRFGQRLTLQSKGFSDIDLAGVDFSRAIFANVEFQNVDLREAKFKGAQFFGVTFNHCNLEKADFTGASGMAVTFDGSNSEKADFGKGRTTIEEKAPDRSEIQFVGRARAKYHSLYRSP